MSHRDEHDEHWGLGGSYERDTETGKRRLLHRTRPDPVIPPIRVELTLDDSTPSFRQGLPESRSQGGQS